MILVLSHYLAVGALAAAACLLGRALTARVGALGRGSGALESAVLRCALGLGGLAYAVFLLGLAGWITRPALIAVLVLAALAGVWVPGGGVAGRGAADRWRRPAPPAVVAAALAAALAIAYLAPLWLAPLYPPTGWAATSYHLAVAKAYALDGRLELLPYLRYPAAPQLQEMLFTLCLSVFDDITAQLVQFLAVLLTAGLLVAWGRREGAPRAGLWAACLWLGSPSVLVFGTTAYVDVGLALYATVAAFAWARWLAGRERAWLAVAGAGAGLAAATKYAGLYFVAALALAAFLHAEQGRRGAALAAFLLPAALCALPWYARNVLLTGNPVHPFLGGVFGHSLWSAADLRLQLDDLAAHGNGRSLGSFLALWGDLALHQRKFVGPEGMFSLAVVIPLPVLLALAWRRPAERTLAVVALAYVCGWFGYAQSGRYLLPVLPTICLLVGVEIERLIAWVGRGWAAGRAGRAAGRPGRGALPATASLAATAALAALLVLPSRVDMARQRARWGPLPTTREARERFLAARYPTYPAYALLNRIYGRRYAVYAYYDGYLAYFADGRFLGDVFGPARYTRVGARLAGGQGLYDELRALGATHFLVRGGRDLPALPGDEAFRRHFLPLLATPAVRLFELR
jgi:4-amino-4-deoxy-L-arabinose transferase-like glycosyltransferase